MAAHHAAFKEILQNEEIKKLREENERLKRAQEPKNHQVQLNVFFSMLAINLNSNVID